jgi:hypothetical protein
MLKAVADVYGRDLTPAVTALYWNAMVAYDIAAVRQALDRHVKNPDTGQFMPKPADLIRMLGGTTQDAALQAWAKVERAIRLVGSWPSVVFDDPLIHAVINDMGGWEKLCRHTSDELIFRGKEFENRYRGFSLRRETPAYPPVLIGRIDTENERLGIPNDVVLVGDLVACQRVRELGREAPPLLGMAPE